MSGSSGSLSGGSTSSASSTGSASSGSISTAVAPATAPILTITAPVVVSAQLAASGVTVTINLLGAKSALYQVYVAVFNQAGSQETTWFVVDLSIGGVGNITLPMMGTGDYFKAVDSVLVPTIVAQSAPVTIQADAMLSSAAISVEHPSPLYTGTQTLPVTISGTLTAGVTYYGGWFTSAPLPADTGFSAIEIGTDNTATVVASIQPPGTPGAFYLSHMTTVMSLWEDTPVPAPATSPGRATAFGISAPGTHAEATFGAGINTTLIISAFGWYQVWVAVFNHVGTQQTDWIPVAIDATTGTGLAVVHMQGTGYYAEVVDDPNATTVRSVSASVTVVPGPKQTATGVTIAVVHLNPLYVGQQTFAVAVAGTIPTGTVYRAAWSSSGAPPLGSSSYHPLTINADGSAQFSVYITNPGVPGGFYTTDGAQITLQWQDTPIDHAGGTSSASAGGAFGILAAQSAQGEIRYDVYAQGETLVLSGTKTYGSPATLKVMVDGTQSIVIGQDLPDGTWEVTLPPVASGNHTISVYADGDVSSISTVLVSLPVGSTAASDDTWLGAYIRCKASIYAALRQYKADLGL